MPEMEKDVSPRASGPAGPQFEAKVATHYALALLAQTEAFGLPGAIVEALEFQRSAKGHPLDDIVVKGRAGDGSVKCLEVQAKRSMAFTEADENFSSIVAGVVAARKLDPERRFAVAIERTTGPIESGVQEALELAKNTPTAAAFFDLLNTPGRSNDAMRRFVGAFRKHLKANGVAGDEDLFQILNRFVVLVFDYARPASIAEHHDRGRARSLIAPSENKDPYDTLFAVVLRMDAIGGQTDRAHLIGLLGGENVQVGAAPTLAKARRRIEEMGRFALLDISTDVAGQQILRAERREALAAMVADDRIVEITGPGGAGKSALLRWTAEAWNNGCRVLVLAPQRVPLGGWPALRTAFDIDATADVFLADMVCDGGGLVCIDGLDRFRTEGEQKTVLDVLRTALATNGARILFTAREGWEEQTSTWLPPDLLQALSRRSTLKIEGLNDDEAKDLASLAPSLASLLSADHPARALARNPFILKRLIRAGIDASKSISEAALTLDWWMSGAHGAQHSSGQQLARRRVLLSVARSLLAGERLADVSAGDVDAVASLREEGVIVEVGATDRVKFKHDLLADWALGCALAESIEALQLETPPPFWLTRGFELSCRLLAERDDATDWSSRVDLLTRDGVQQGWAGLAVLALARSENASALLERHSEALLRNDGAVAAILIRRMIAAHGTPAEQVLGPVLPEGTEIPKGLTFPDANTWLPLVGWCLRRFSTLPSLALGAAIDLFEKWLVLLTFGEKVVSPVLLDRFADLLVAHVEDLERPLSYRRREEVPEIRYPVGSDSVHAARLQLALYAQHAPAAATRYLNAIAASPRAGTEMQALLEFPGSLAASAPASFAAAFRRAVKNERDDLKRHDRRDIVGPRFGPLEHPFVLGRAGIAVFADLLEKDSEAGLTFIRELVDDIEECHKDNRAFELTLNGAVRRVTSPFSYGWSRGQCPSTILSKALAALEDWAHRQVESGKTVGEVVSHIAGGGTISGAFLLVVVDVVLSNSNLSSAELADLITSPETLSLDAHRAQVDHVERMTGRSLSVGLGGSRNQKDRQIEASLSERSSRRVALHDALAQVVVLQEETATAALRSRLQRQVERLGGWSSEVVDWSSPQFMASHALLLASKENYSVTEQAGTDGVEGLYWQIRWPENQKRWLETQSASATAESNSYTRALAVRMAMNNDKDEARVGTAEAEAVLAENVSAGPNQTDEDHDPKDPWLARVGAAAFLARYAEPSVVNERRSELEAIFDEALGPNVKAEHNYRFDVMYDARALAITGRLYLATRVGNPQIEKLLSAIQMFPESAAAAFRCHRNAAAALGQERLAACARVGLQSCIFPRRKDFDEADEVFEQRRTRSIEDRAKRLAEEVSWLGGAPDEPGWPSPPSRRQRGKSSGTRGERGRVVESGFSDFYFDDRTGDVWLDLLSRTTIISPDRIAALVRASRAWLLETNGPAGSDEDDRDYERAWTRGIFECAASRAKVWSSGEREELIFDVLKGFSNQAFISAAAAFLVQSDLLHIEGGADDTAYLVELRQRLWSRLKETHRWQQHLWSSSRRGMEINLHKLIGAFFFKVSEGFGGMTGYMGGFVDAQLKPFLPVLTEISVAVGACRTISPLLLDVLEKVSPDASAKSLLEAAACWEKSASPGFWEFSNIGTRVASLASRQGINTDDKPAWIKIADSIAAAGVAEGEQLKRKLQRS